MQLILRYIFPQTRFYGQCSSQRPPACVGVKINKIFREYIKHMRPEGDYNLYFLLGADTDDESTAATEAVLAEIKEKRDLIVGDFPDTYDNLPIKTYLGYQVR